MSKLAKHYGNLPLYSRGINKGRLDRQKLCEIFSFTLNEITKAYLNWQDIFRMEGSSLTFEQYLNKLKEVNITPSKVGNSKGQWNLSRHNDKGPYTLESCRFITREMNRKEQKVERIPMIHGTANAYVNWKCRCPECKEANRKRCRKYKRSSTG